MENWSKTKISSRGIHSQLEDFDYNLAETKIILEPVTCIWRSDYHIRYFHPSLALFCFLLEASRSRLCIKGPQRKDSIIVATFHKSFDGKFSSRITSSECIFSASGSLNLIIILIASKISVGNSLSWNARYRTIDVEIKAAQYTLWIDQSSFGPRSVKRPTLKHWRRMSERTSNSYGFVRDLQLYKERSFLLHPFPRFLEISHKFSWTKFLVTENIKGLLDVITLLNSKPRISNER